jgi:tetratricopeptide (TPR) repeat protein
MPTRSGVKVIGVLIVLAAIVAVAWLVVSSWRQRLPRSIGGPSAPSVAAAKPTRQPPPLLPDIGLWVNSSDRAEVRQRTPLVFSVRLANHQAMNAALANATRQKYLASIDERVQRGDLSGEDAATMRAAVQPEAAVRPMAVGTANRTWASFVRFELFDTNPRALDWALRPIPPSESTLVLDARTTAEVAFVLSPEAADGIAPGEYRVAAVIDVPAEAGAADAWHGLVRSKPVTVTVVPAPAGQDAAAEAHAARLRARYFAKIGDWKQSLADAERAASLEPTSIDAHVLVGEALKATGDPDGALAAFREARRQYEAQHGGPPDEPSYIADQISLLTRDRLRRIAQPAG